MIYKDTDDDATLIAPPSVKKRRDVLSSWKHITPYKRLEFRTIPSIYQKLELLILLRDQAQSYSLEWES